LKQSSERGFTLVELLITVTIIAVISVIAVPAYKEQADRGRRAEGKAYLLDLASRQERFYTQYSSYTGTVAATSGCVGSVCGLGMEDGYSGDDHFSGAVTVLPSGCTPTGTLCVSYTLSATALITDSKCGALTYDSTGKKGVSGVSDQASIDYCWR